MEVMGEEMMGNDRKMKLNEGRESKGIDGK